MEELGLERFIKKQEEYYELALKEINNGKKVSCWMWYIFPQIRGLGKSKVSIEYSLKNIEEAKDYLCNEKLGFNLVQITQALLNLGEVDIKEVMGYIDDVKLKSCMTLFNEVEQKYNINCGNIFQKVLHQFFNDEKDELTLKILENQKNSEKNEENDKNEKKEFKEEKKIDDAEANNDEDEKENKNTKDVCSKYDNKKKEMIKDNSNIDENELLKDKSKAIKLLNKDIIGDKQKNGEIKKENISKVNKINESKNELNKNEDENV